MSVSEIQPSTPITVRLPRACLLPFWQMDTPAAGTSRAEARLSALLGQLGRNAVEQEQRQQQQRELHHGRFLLLYEAACLLVYMEDQGRIRLSERKQVKDYLARLAGQGGPRIGLRQFDKYIDVVRRLPEAVALAGKAGISLLWEVAAVREGRPMDLLCEHLLADKRAPNAVIRRAAQAAVLAQDAGQSEEEVLARVRAALLQERPDPKEQLRAAVQEAAGRLEELLAQARAAGLPREFQLVRPGLAVVPATPSPVKMEAVPRTAGPAKTEPVPPEPGPAGMTMLMPDLAPYGDVMGFLRGRLLPKQQDSLAETLVKLAGGIQPRRVLADIVRDLEPYLPSGHPLRPAAYSWMARLREEGRQRLAIHSLMALRLPDYRQRLLQLRARPGLAADLRELLAFYCQIQA